jgi:hypothetical protein
MASAGPAGRARQDPVRLQSRHVSRGPDVHRARRPARQALGRRPGELRANRLPHRAWSSNRLGGGRRRSSRRGRHALSPLHLRRVRPSRRSRHVAGLCPLRRRSRLGVQRCVGGWRRTHHGRRRRRRHGHRRRRGLRRRRLRGWRRLHRRWQEEERVEVSLRVGGPAHAEVHVRHRVLGRAARADGADGGPFDDRRTPFDRQRSEMQQRHGVAVGRLDRDRAAACRHCPGERDEARGRRGHGGAQRRADVDAAVEAAGIGVGAEAEPLQHRPLNRPGPAVRARGRNESGGRATTREPPEK